MSAPRSPQSPASERARLAPFQAVNTGRPRDQQDLMERPFFSLSKSRRVAPILYKASDVEVQVLGVPEHGLATIWDADVLIWAASQIVEAEDHGLATSRFFRFTPYGLLRAIGRATGATEYRLLKRALMRLQSTVVATTIRHGAHWRRQQFSWINEWEEMTARSGRIEGMEFVLPDWFYRGVVDRSLVLTIDPAYFRLTGGVERWLYRLVRKHAGRQRAGWSFEIAHLHAKSGSLARPSDFALDLRRIVARQPLPGYRLRLDRRGAREILHFVSAEVSTGPVNKSVNQFVRSGAPGLVTSGADLSGYRTHDRQLTLWADEEIDAPNLESNTESNLVVEDPPLKVAAPQSSLRPSATRRRAP
nr:replication initiator protein A [Caulobacter sp. S45]